MSAQPAVTLDPATNLAPTPDPAALARAEQARVNGARSRGPVTAIGKARSSRNALRHGLRAQLLVPEEDEAAFRGMAGRLFAEIGPAGELEGFLVADLATAMWRSGRARRLEAQALAGEEPDAARLELALRYQGSASRDLFRLLRALQGLRRRPLTVAADPVAEGVALPPAGDAVPEAGPPEIAASIPALPEVAELAWGGGAAGLPPPPPGCLMLRPVRYAAPRKWHQLQGQAFPAAPRVPVDAQGNVHALEDGRWVQRAWPADRRCRAGARRAATERTQPSR